MRTGAALSCFLPLLAVTFPAAAQSVISTHSGVVYYFDGSVTLADRPLQQHLGTFPTIGAGVELRTAKGRAEVLLTPGVFLRVGENSSIRMLGNSLANTRVELLAGSAILDSGQPAAGTSVTLTFRDWQIHSAEAGSYRVDSDPPKLWVLKGNADVTTAGGQPVKVDEGMDLPFAKVLVPDQTESAPNDALSAWDQGRSDSIVADNAITQQIDADPATQSADVDGFSYFPMLGVPAVGLYSSPYPSVIPAQPGFYSMYLPGYTYQPLLLGLMGRGLLTSYPIMPLRLGTTIGIGHIGGIGGIGHPGGLGGGIGNASRPIMPRSVMPMRPMVRPMARPMIRR
ncbi:MAG TPA: hypothetical protein VMB85_26910 [Bryobacteraceae bacterium]|jgi:hypothetical protein|nr:hypothetical protein [Bryobacteraceae bacterium]